MQEKRSVITKDLGALVLTLIGEVFGVILGFVIAFIITKFKTQH